MCTTEDVNTSEVRAALSDIQGVDVKTLRNRNISRVSLPPSLSHSWNLMVFPTLVLGTKDSDLEGESR